MGRRGGRDGGEKSNEGGMVEEGREEVIEEIGYEEGGTGVKTFPVFSQC